MEKYIPLLKTTDAELKAYAQLSEVCKQGITPVFELTKSRKTKLEADGNIDKRMSQIRELVEDRKFILDLTAHEDMVNYQIEELLDEDGGFSNWRDFLVKHNDLNIVPAVHLNPDEPNETIRLLEWLEQNYAEFALRLEPSDPDFKEYFEIINRAQFTSRKLTVILDAQYVTRDNLDEVRRDCESVIEHGKSISGLTRYVVLSSSFPKSVVGHTTECRDDKGRITKLEPLLYEGVKTAVAADASVDVIYGDFASVHPVRNMQGGGGWVPRVDFPLDDAFIYTRVRRNEGGYVEAARRMVNNPEYKRFDAWGCDEIESAARGTPGGLSPSYWIAARINMHITKEVTRLSVSKEGGGRRLLLPNRVL